MNRAEYRFHALNNPKLLRTMTTQDSESLTLEQQFERFDGLTRKRKKTDTKRIPF